MPAQADALTGAIQYYDAQVDDARHTMTIVRTAAGYGALRRQPHPGHRLHARRASGSPAPSSSTWRPARELDVHAKQVINATGVWTDDTQQMAGTRGQFHVRASKGIHLVVPRDRIQSTTGLILRTEKSVLFVIPWGRHWIIGTTDTDWTLDKAAPRRERAGHRLPARPRQLRADLAAVPRRRRGRLRRAAAAAVR